MKTTCLHFLSVAALVSGGEAVQAADDQVVAFWGFAEAYDFAANPNKQDFAADVDSTVTADANLQAFLGEADELDDNGGNGFVSYTSIVSGVTYDPTRTLKWDDLKGGGDDFDIGGADSFLVDKLDGAGPLADDFGNDALIYLTLNGTGYRDFHLRFDIEGTPGDLPSTFDVFYRVDGPTGTWFRDPSQNNLPLSFFDYDPVDPDNQFADSGVISLSSVLNDSATIEVLVNDFAENGNDQMQIDNVELVASLIPEPSASVVALAGLLVALSRPPK